MNLAKIFLATTVAGALCAFSFTQESGVRVGESVSAFEPFHVTGADRGTYTCPVCKYGPVPAVQIWVNTDNLVNVGKLAQTLETRIDKAGSRNLKTFFVFLDPKLKTVLPGFASKYQLKNVALLYVQGANDEATKAYGINTSPEVKNTVMVYTKRQVVANYVNLKSDAKGLEALNGAVDKALAQ